ncbi:hypothetical protein, partial [Actinomadura sediminis]
MNTGDTVPNSDTAERALRALRPAALDDLARDAHERRRDEDLARILRTSRRPAARRPLPRRPVLLIASVAAGACAVTGVAVTAGGDPA